ncbi:hypothetical protein GGX14DRAFT_451203 [Mycena pura]|uniref:Uncharacterized protein n=1 Tax=Mycena pura TaxID=153505 RepID=A0AAD6VKT7_9AGAR|nr:hypothetical protein GGX14DRAFT_451203 [Mycena pura]
MTHRLRDDTRVFATGFLLNRDEITELAQRALSTDFLASHGNDAVLAFKWHMRQPFELNKLVQYACEALVTNQRDRFLIAVHFFPWVIGELVPRELADIPTHRKEMWHQHYGLHYGQYAAKKYPVGMVPYPRRLGAIFFLPKYIDQVVASHDLGELLVPVKSSGTILLDCSHCLY